MDKYVESLVKNMSTDILKQIVSQLSPAKHLEYAIKSATDVSLIELIIDNMDINVKIVNVTVTKRYKTETTQIRKNFYDNSDILLQLFNYDYKLYCRLIHRCNDNMIPVKLVPMWHDDNKNKNTTAPLMCIMGHMDMIKPFFDNMQYSDDIMIELYNATLECGNMYIYRQVNKLFPQQFINFLKKPFYFDARRASKIPCALGYLTPDIHGKYNNNNHIIIKDILSKIFDGTLLITPNHFFNSYVLDCISGNNMYYIVKKYKPLCSIPIQEIFNWYCYMNTPYCQYIVKNYKVEIPTIETFFRCVKTYYYNDPSYIYEYTFDKYKQIEKYLYSLGSNIIVRKYSHLII